MPLTKRKAISECKKLWTEIVASGISKSNFLGRTDDGEKWLDKKYANDCPLCEYSGPCCNDCPLVVQHGTYCGGLGYNADEEGRKSFLNYVNELK